MARELTVAIEGAYAERVNLFVVALTGRTGSGCTTAATAMSRSIDDLPASSENLSPIEKRKLDICQSFARVQWVPFQVLTVSNVIFSFLLDEETDAVKKFLSVNIKGAKRDDVVGSLLAEVESLKAHEDYGAFNDLVGPEHQHHNSGAAAWSFYRGPLSLAAARLKMVLGTQYASLFQTLGDNIRTSGSSLNDSVDTSHIFRLITRVKRLGKAARRWDHSQGNTSTRVVIDAVRNPLELVYLRDQFAAFYVIAITANEEDRQNRLAQSMAKKDIENLDKREYSKKALSGYDNFVSQNLQECIQKSDIFVHNNGKPDDFERTKMELHQQLIRYVTLMLRPGLVTPTSDERCMQLAFVAKLNSGCISRQVGAAITDSSFSIKAVGWNDVPRGQVSCLLRDATALLTTTDEVAFSDYESKDRPFRAHMAESFKNSVALRTNTGLSCPYCFKDAYNAVTGEKNQVHTRSLHAEENAFLQLAKHGNSGIEGGQLYTTASPCELCSKKAFQLGIKEIIYVDPYPGISSKHILAAGIKSLRPSLRLFGGAVGNAYHRLYEAVLPIKDEFAARLRDDPPPQPGLF